MKSMRDLLSSIPGCAMPALSAEELALAALEISRRDSDALAVERQRTRQRRVESSLARSAVPVRYRDAVLRPLTREQAPAYRAAVEFVTGFSDRLRSGAGMVITGPVGTGKTHLACAVANALIGQLRPVMYCTALEAVALVRSSWRRDGDLSEFDVYARFGDPQLLIIDEIGVQLGSDFERMVLTTVADIRSRNCLPTVVVSNLSPMELHGLLGERLFDRLVGFGADVVTVPGRSLRGVGV
ncbi:ATP-binding protein [Methylomonas sp. CM2]|uniref:ATP-binding protein n=1 Tax=Methylomonas sp. CM2 TaxID=3417647 RepID=UPI003CF8E61B